MSSKAALSILSKAVSFSPLAPMVLHMESTYKLNINEFPVLMLSIFDAQQQFHMVGIGVMSHHSEAVYKELLWLVNCLLLHVVPDINFPPNML
jgi:hypothetical protein